MRDEERRNIILDWLDEQYKLASAMYEANSHSNDSAAIERSEQANDRIFVLGTLRDELLAQTEKG